VDKHWEHFEHEADIGVRGYGHSMADAFEQAALAMTAIVTDPVRIKPDTMIEVSRFELDPELLFIDWLNAVVYEMSTRHMLFCRYELRIEEGRLEAQLFGEIIDRQRHEPVVEIKGATYTELRVTETEEGGWLAQCVVDV
jgi:tRNA nucleotidyltransferase (CCA-adding enzyme)